MPKIQKLPLVLFVFVVALASVVGWQACLLSKTSKGFTPSGFGRSNLLSDADVGLDKDKLDLVPVASVNTTQNSFSLLDTDFGHFLVMSKAVEPFLDGYKVTLKVGNLYNAAFQGEIGVSWGTNSKTQIVPQEIASGAWTEVPIIISPAKPEEVKQLIVSLEIKGVTMRAQRASP